MHKVNNKYIIIFLILQIANLQLTAQKFNNLEIKRIYRDITNSLSEGNSKHDKNSSYAFF